MSSTRTTDASPRNRYDAIVLRIVRDVLGVADVSRNTNIFDAGCSSLQALQILGEVERVLGVRPPLKIVYEAQTPGALSDVLIAGVAAPAHPIIELTAAPSASSVVVVHGIGGDVVFAGWHLGEALYPSFSTYGVESPGLYSDELPYTSIAAAATYYIDELVARVPSPYVVCGYSAGAMFALEIAHQLQARDLAPSLVVALDFPLWDDTTLTKICAPLLDEAERSFSLIPRGLGPIELPTREEFLSLPARERHEIIVSTLRDLGVGSALVDHGFVARTLSLSGKHAAMLLDHEFRTPYRGDVMVVQTSGPADGGYWRQLASSVGVVSVTASHQGLLQPPAVRRVAEAIYHGARRSS